MCYQPDLTLPLRPATENTLVVPKPSNGELTPGTAGIRLAHIYELLELLLLDLAPQDLLRAQAVSKSFAVVIRTSEVLQKRFQMILAKPPCETISFPVQVPRLFDYVGSRWSHSPQGGNPYVLVWIRKSQLGEQRWRKSATWRNLLLATDKLKSITVHVEGWEDHWMGTGGSAPFNLKMRCEKEDAGITLGDLADVAFELYDLDESVDVKFSTYVDEKGEACVHRWEKFAMVPYRETVERARAARDLSTGCSSNRSVTVEGGSQVQISPSADMAIASPCVAGQSILRGFCEHQGPCIA